MTINEEIEELGKQFGSYTDYDGSRAYYEPEDESVYVRLAVLEEVGALSKGPVLDSWKMEMHFGYCCASSSEFDPMGDMMGRNN